MTCTRSCSCVSTRRLTDLLSLLAYLLTYPLRYAKLQLCLYKALVVPFDMKDARKCAKEDWSSDVAKGEKGMSRAKLKESLFEMVDVSK